MQDSSVTARSGKTRKPQRPRNSRLTNNKRMTSNKLRHARSKTLNNRLTKRSKRLTRNNKLKPKLRLKLNNEQPLSNINRQQPTNSKAHKSATLLRLTQALLSAAFKTARAKSTKTAFLSSDLMENR